MRPLRDVADAVAGAADALQARARPTSATRPGARGRRRPCRCRARASEVATRHGSSPALSSSSTTSALLARERAVVGARDLRPAPSSSRQLVSRSASRSARAAVVDEDDRRAVLADQLEQLGVDRRPDRAAASPRCRRRRGSSRSASVGLRPARPSTRPARGSSGRAACARRRRRSVHVAPRADQEAADLLERVLRRRQADALERPPLLGERLEPLERQREVRAALGARRRRGSRRRSPTRRRASISRACEVSIR